MLVFKCGEKGREDGHTRTLHPDDGQSLAHG